MHRQQWGGRSPPGRSICKGHLRASRPRYVGFQGQAAQQEPQWWGLGGTGAGAGPGLPLAGEGFHDQPPPVCRASSGQAAGLESLLCPDWPTASRPGWLPTPLLQALLPCCGGRLPGKVSATRLSQAASGESSPPSSLKVPCPASQHTCANLQAHPDAPLLWLLPGRTCGTLPPPALACPWGLICLPTGAGKMWDQPQHQGPQDGAQ